MSRVSSPSATGSAVRAATSTHDANSRATDCEVPRRPSTDLRDHLARRPGGPGRYCPQLLRIGRDPQPANHGPLGHHEARNVPAGQASARANLITCFPDSRPPQDARHQPYHTRRGRQQHMAGPTGSLYSPMPSGHAAARPDLPWSRYSPAGPGRLTCCSAVTTTGPAGRAWRRQEPRSTACHRPDGGWPGRSPQEAPARPRRRRRAGCWPSPVRRDRERWR